MAANPTIYCLQELTDYAEFESLCTDLMELQGYKGIEPLGGFKDKGRDAIHLNKANKTTIFAYSVREDWRAKLAEDASKIQKHGHTCNSLVFITTSRFTAGERDEAVNFIQKRYGWTLQLFGAARLRILLDVNYPELKKNYPQIFPPQFLTEVASYKNKKHLFVHYAAANQVLGDWLTRKLTTEGYFVWSENLKTLGDDKFPQDIDDAIKNKTFRFISLYSKESLKTPELTRQRNIALNKMQDDKIEEFLIPLYTEDIDSSSLDKITANLKFIAFKGNWAAGYRQLIEKLNSLKAPKLLQNGRIVAASSFLGKDMLSGKTEKLLSNCLRIEKIPNIIRSYSSEKAISDDDLKKMQHIWPHKKVTDNLLVSFQKPPQKFIDNHNIELASSYSWRQKDKIMGIRTNNIVSELIKKSFLAKLKDKKLISSIESDHFYFPHGVVDKDHLQYKIPDGKSNYVKIYGERKYWKPSGAEKYRYSLSPEFTVKQNFIDEFIVLVRIKVRLTDEKDQILSERVATSRRKHLCKDWWNNDWLTRMLAVCQYLSDKNSKIIIGQTDDEQIVINATPIIVKSPIGINERALDQNSFEREEFLADDEELSSDIEKE